MQQCMHEIYRIETDPHVGLCRNRPHRPANVAVLQMGSSARRVGGRASRIRPPGYVSRRPLGPFQLDSGSAPDSVSRPSKKKQKIRKRKHQMVSVWSFRDRALNRFTASAASDGKPGWQAGNSAPGPTQTGYAQTLALGPRAVREAPVALHSVPPPTQTHP